MAPTDDFDRRLARAKGQQGGPAPRDGNPSALGQAFRIGTELIAGVGVGGVLGFFLDKWLGTSPLLLIVFFLLGTAAGFLNVFRHAREMNALAARDADKLPSVPDDDDD